MRIASEILAAIFNSLWQAAVIAGLVFLILKLFRRINAATRYAIWWAVLAVTLALPAAPMTIAWWRARARPAASAEIPKRAAPRTTLVPVIEEQPAMVTLKEERSARWPAWVLAVATGVFLYRLGQIGRSYFYLRGVKRRAVASETALPSIPRPARLLLSEDIASPMAVGFLHPAVILPESLPSELAQSEMEHVLLHEAAHIARRDDWRNLLARVLGGALALHPVAWWILRQIEREHEIACDDWVVAHTGRRGLRRAWRACRSYAGPGRRRMDQTMDRAMDQRGKRSPQGFLAAVPVLAKGLRCCWSGGANFRRAYRGAAWR